MNEAQTDTQLSRSTAVGGERGRGGREEGRKGGMEPVGWQRSPRVERDETNSSRTFSVPVDPPVRHHFSQR